MAATPQVKFEDSPAESFISTPGAEFPSLFGTSADPETVMTPQSIVDVDDSLMSDAIKTEPTSTDDDDAAALGTPAPDGEKKSAKKRKSWGQVLPEPKTNLPPRKRAKTEDEKEQRRVERVLRNRRAAQSSRERKRQEAENLEKRAQASEKRCEELESMVRALMDELNRTRSEGSSRNPLPTLSQSLFRSTQTDTSFLDNSSNATVDPASLSPAMTPEPDVDALVSSAPAAPSTPTPAATTSTDETQHSAAVLCDPQCPMVEVPQSWMVPQQQQQQQAAMALMFQLQLLSIVSSQMISLFQSPLRLIHSALKFNFHLLPIPTILREIVQLVTRPPEFLISPSSTSPSSSMTSTAAQLQALQRDTAHSSKNPSPSSASSSLRIKTLQRILTSSPILARPLLDATMEVLRLVVSEGSDDRVEGLAEGSPGIKGDQSRPPLMWPNGASLPSKELLLQLMWSIRVEERKTLIQKAREATKVSLPMSAPVSRPGSSSVLREMETNQTLLYVSSAVPTTAERKSQSDMDSSKRLKLSY